MSRPAIVYHPDYEMDIGEHVFPTEKFRLVRDALVARGLVREDEIVTSRPATEDELLLAVTRPFLDEMTTFRHTLRTLRSEVPISREIIEGFILTAGGSVECARLAAERGGACHIGGGFHHAFADHAEGFCYINDVAVAAMSARKAGVCSRVAIIDTDLHQGNGTAHIFREEPDVFTCSVHQELLYPIPKQTSDIDIGLPNGTDDDGYCEPLQRAMDHIMAEFKPEFLMYVAGVDPYFDDQLGALELTKEGLARRDRIVLSAASKVGIPFVTFTAGGYAYNVQDTVDLHVQTIQIAMELLAGRA
ncbi:histone deacetylase [bacterium]|nr:histone deacetylase [bacterium]